MRRFFLLLAFLLTACGGTAREVKRAAPLTIRLATEKMTLPNGLVVVLHRDLAAQTVAVRVRYFVGAKDDPGSESGLAHLYEHLMFAGTAHTAPLDFHAALEKVGGFATNGATSLDHTDYYESAPPEMLGRLLWLEADRMQSRLSNVDGERLAREKAVVGNEGRERSDRGHAAAYDIGFSNVFPAGHPYAVQRRDDNAGVMRAQLEELRAFGERYYRPNNAAVVVAGNFDIPTAKDLVTKAFGRIAPGEPIARLMVPPATAKMETVDVKDPGAPHRIALAWIVPGHGQDGYDEIALAAAVLRSALTGDMVRKRELATDVDVTLYGGRLGSLFSITITPKNPGDNQRALEVLFDDLKEVRRNVGRWDGFEPNRLARVTAEALDFDGVPGRAKALLDALETYGDPARATQSLLDFQAIESEDVGTAIQTFLLDAPRTTLVMSP